jgi:hypothetical protein
MSLQVSGTFKQSARGMIRKPNDPRASRFRVEQLLAASDILLVNIG